MSETTLQPEEQITPEIEALFHAGAHVAYRKTRRHPKMRPFIAGVKSNVEIFHLDKVDEQITAACAHLEFLGEGKKVVMWVGTKPAAEQAITAIGTELKHPYVSRRWLGGTLTNFRTIKTRIAYLESLEAQRDRGEFEKYRKHERMRKGEEIEKMNQSFGSVRSLARMPDVVVIVDVNEESTALSESRKTGVPIIGIMNSDCDPSGVKFPIPANDNAQRSIEHILMRLKDAYLVGLTRAPAVDAPQVAVATPTVG
ncbi:MAG: 30S ribosomal protein S2 [Patescibacteria group bacterium]